MAIDIRTEHPHIVRNSDVCGGRAVIAGTRLSVEFIVAQLAAGDSTGDLITSYPDLTRASIFDALSFYYDHQAEIDESIAKSHPEMVATTHSLEIAADGRVSFRNT